MTRSDLVLEIVRLDKMSDEDKTRLIHHMHKKIENAYKIVFMLEADETFAPLGKNLREALES